MSRPVGGCGEWPLSLLHVYEPVDWFTHNPDWRWWLMMNIRSMLRSLKSSAISIVVGAALLLLWVVGDVRNVPHNPRLAET